MAPKKKIPLCKVVDNRILNHKTSPFFIVNIILISTPKAATNFSPKFLFGVSYMWILNTSIEITFFF